jgi:hypothetical protein
MTIILRNRARCKKCYSVIESLNRHDYKTCKCGAISVDGGLAYLRRTGEIGSIEELSRSVESFDKMDLETTKTLLEDYKEWVSTYEAFTMPEEKIRYLKARFYDRWVDRIEWLIKELEEKE